MKEDYTQTEEKWRSEGRTTHRQRRGEGRLYTDREVKEDYIQTEEK